MEYLDIVDTDDKVISKATREDVYKKSLCHRIVHVLVFNDKNEMALQLRSRHLSFCPNHWSTAVGGHVHSGESYTDAAMREYDEELGVTSEIQNFSKDYYQAENSPNKFVVAFKSQFNGPFNPDPEEVEKADFFSMEEIKTMIENKEKFHPELLFLLKKYFLTK
jgi:isopentenyldiphosphate isomerase